MTELLESTWIYIKDLGAEHNVNPILFGLLYVASIPPYLGSMGWIVRNYRKHKPLALPIISTLFFSFFRHLTSQFLEKMSPGGYMRLLPS